MKHRAVPGLVVAVLAAWLGAVAPGPAAAGPQVEQTVVLHPGWNAVFLEVQPEPAAPASVFAGLPVRSVWAWVPRATTVEYVQDPTEERLRAAGWHVWFPASPARPAFLTNLFGVQANRAYLVELGGDRPATLTLSGAPSLRREAWVQDSFSFTGFTVDPAAPPTFAAFFAASPAHAGQPVFRLGEEGAWRMVDDPAATRMRPGEAFWVYTSGASDYAGPLQALPEHGEALEFSRLVPQALLRVRNLGASPRSVVMRQAGALPLARKRLSAAGLPAWPSLEEDRLVALDPNAEARVPLALRQAGVPAGGGAAVLEVTDGEGSLLRVPVSAAAPLLTPAGTADYRGLWMGTVTVNAVTEAQIPARPAFTQPQPTGPQEFTFRVILHVAADGAVSLLKEVTQMWQPVAVPCSDAPGSTCLCPAGDAGATCDQGHYVLVTDDALIPRFSPAALLGGRPFSYRVSTAAFDFPGLQAGMTGAFGPAGVLACTVEVPADLPTNPFLHGYHPDHNNLDEEGKALTDARRLEAFPVTRALTFAFSADEPGCAGIAGCASPPDWLVDRMGGVYRETLGGLHRNAITVAGVFTLQRVTDVAELNPVPAP